MSHVLKKGDAIFGSVVIRATAQDVYEVVSDPTRIPEWSPECRRCEWVDDSTFRGYNKRRLGRWKTVCHVNTATPDREFVFSVQYRGHDFTRWSYRIAEHPDGCVLTQEFFMCIDLPWVALTYERLALGVRDRRTDLQGNIDQSLRRIRAIVESSAGTASSATRGAGATS